MGDWVRVTAVELVVGGGFERLVMRRHRAILQATRNMEPAKPVLVENEWAISLDAVQSAFVTFRLKGWFLLQRKVRLVPTDPLALTGIPPHELFALAPRRPL